MDSGAPDDAADAEREPDGDVVAIELCNGQDEDSDGAIDEDCAAPGSIIWIKQVAAVESGNGVAGLPDGGAIVTGVFSGNATFGAGEIGEVILRSSTGQDDDVFVARYAANGELAWARSAGGPNNDRGSKVAACADGSVLVVGEFLYEATFGRGGASEVVLVPSDGLNAIFLAKYDSEGNLLWAKRADGPGREAANGVASLSDCSAVVTGSFNGDFTLGGGDERSITLTSAGVDDIFLAKYDAAGSVVWAQRAGGAYFDDSGQALVVHSDGSVLVTGAFTSQATFGPGTAGDVTLHAAQVQDIFVAKYDRDGSLLWATRIGDLGSDQGRGVASLDDGVLVTGYEGQVPSTSGPDAGTTTVARGDPAMFVSKHSLDGTVIWTRRNEGQGASQGNDIAPLADGSAVLVGSFKGTAAFVGGAAPTLTSAGEYDLFLIKSDPQGAWTWATRCGGEGTDYGLGLTRAGDGSLLMTGKLGDGASCGSVAGTLAPGFFIAKVAP